MDKKHILVVDDEKGMRSMLTSALCGAGFMVTTAGDGAEALVLLTRRDNSSAMIDFLVTDYILPGLTGLELIDRLREECIDVPTVVISGNHDEALEAEVLSKGCVAFLRKPFSISVLIEDINRVFGGKLESVSV